MGDRKEIHRRQAMQRVGAVVLAPSLAQLSESKTADAASPVSPEHSSPATRNSVAVENSRPGSSDWLLTKTRIDPQSKYRCPWVEGYASHASIGIGETLQLMVSTETRNNVQIDLYRTGFYGGTGARLVHRWESVPTSPQPLPTPGVRNVMVCEWEPTVELKIGQDWVSGVYVAKLTEAKEGLQSYIVFIVRDDAKHDYLFQCSDHTWQAYNRWPSQFSIYDHGKQEWYWGGESEVSFRRPYGKYCQIFDQPQSIGSGEYFLWEYPFAYWLESLGMDVGYISNTDTHRDQATLMRGKGLLSVGHDEYWSIEMFQNVRNARDKGLHLGFFSGNAICGRVEWSDERASFHRVGVFSPPGGIREFNDMDKLRFEPPFANELIGAHSVGIVTGGADWICTKPDHWVYQNTGMAMGDRIPGLIGWEWHGDPAQIPGLEIIAEGDTQSAPGTLNGGHYTATVYETQKGVIVFNASTCWWADGLSHPPGYLSPSVYTTPKGTDPRVQAITRNVLERMVRPR